MSHVEYRRRTPRLSPGLRAALTLALAGLVATACSPEAGDVPESSPGGTPSVAPAPAGDTVPGARFQPGTSLGIYAPEQHALYDGRWVLTGTRIFQVGTLTDAAPWDHMGDDGSDVRAVEGRIEIDVNEIDDTGTFVAELDLPEGRYVVRIDRFQEFSPCQDGGIAAFLFEHGDAGCGDANWPKSLLYLAGWGIGSATLDGEPLHEEYQIHFMVTQGMRDRETLAVRAGAAVAGGPGAVNPAMQQLDFYIRSPETDDRNHPNRAVFDHFFAMEVTWR